MTILYIECKSPEMTIFSEARERDAGLRNAPAMLLAFQSFGAEPLQIFTMPS